MKWLALTCTFTSPWEPLKWFKTVTHPTWVMTDEHLRCSPSAESHVFKHVTVHQPSFCDEDMISICFMAFISIWITFLIRLHVIVMMKVAVFVGHRWIHLRFVGVALTVYMKICNWIWNGLLWFYFVFGSGVLGLNIDLCPILSSYVPVCVFSEMSLVSWPNSWQYVCF